MEKLYQFFIANDAWITIGKGIWVTVEHTGSSFPVRNSYMSSGGAASMTEKWWSSEWTLPTPRPWSA